MEEKIINRLCTVKSIVTILLTVVFCFLAVVGKVSQEQVMTVFTVVISFYFGSQSERLNSKLESDTENN